MTPLNNWWALLALALVVATAAGNILVCLAIAWERRLQNVTNYFLMSLAITDLMVAVLVMPVGILTLVRGFFPLPSVYCLAWICLDVLFCTASIMHLTTISVDRYLSLRYPMKFGRNKTRRRVTLKIVFVWLLSIAMSLPLSLMYSQNHDSVLVDGTCQIPDALYKLIGSIVCFYIPLGVMLLTYTLTVRLLNVQQHNLGGGSNTADWSSGWLGGPTAGVERRGTWRRLLMAPGRGPPQQSGTSTDTELTTLDSHDLWLPEESAPSAVSALHQFGAEMLRLVPPRITASEQRSAPVSPSSSQTSLFQEAAPQSPVLNRSNAVRRRPSTIDANTMSHSQPSSRRGSNLNEAQKRWRTNSESSSTSATEEHKTDCSADIESLPFPLPPPCTCPYFGSDKQNVPKSARVESNIIVSKCTPNEETENRRDDNTVSDTSPTKKTNVLGNMLRTRSELMVTWDASQQTTGQNFGIARTHLLLNSASGSHCNTRTTPILRRAQTVKHHNGTGGKSGSPCLLRYGSGPSRSGTVRSHHSRNSSVISRNSSRHGRILRLEQKATKVLGVVFFTFVILWAPFFVLNLVPTVCEECERNIDHRVYDLVTWLGYASSMVNPIFYTIFNKMFRQAFKKVLLCQYKKKTWRHSP